MSTLEPGAVFGRDFRIVKALRAGGMGAVYIVDQLSTGKQRALKVMAPELASDQATRDRFELEARAASKLESEHVVEIVTAGIDEATGAPFLVMELLKGEELADAAQRTGALPLGDVAEILSQVGHALEQAHALGIVHRDLKPENIFLAASKRRDAAFTVKILDFGIAKLVADSQKTGTQPLGTPLFMSPEQTDRRGKICPATDVWALGLIAFRLLTGHDYWREADGSLTHLLREICIDELPFASVRANELGLPQAIPPGFDAWFARCVNRNIDARFQEAGECVRAFSELVAIDAPRGALVLQRSGGSGSLGVSAAMSGSASGPVKVTPPRATPFELERTGAVAADPRPVVQTGDALVATGAPAMPKNAGFPKVAVALGALLIGGVAAFFVVKGQGHDAPTQASSATPATSSAPVVAAAAAKTSCPSTAVLVTGGKMFMGARDLKAEDGPPHEVAVSSFCLDKTEVTVAAYQACADKGDCERALDVVKWPDIKEETKKRYSPFCNATHPERKDHPINCVAWAMADTYCKKAGARLPTEAEWEFAARGSSQRKYPWGDDPPSGKRLNACGKECQKWGTSAGEEHATMHDDDDGYAATAPVGSFKDGAAMGGIMDLAGNVWEWTSDWYAPYSTDPSTDPKGPATGKRRVARGGDFFSSKADWARPAWRWSTDPETYNHAIGFRCAADPK